jgi:tetratricopeptide (TPR) repeat protein
MRISYNKFEHELNSFLKAYLEDESFDHLKDRLNLPESEIDTTSGKINEFYRDQLQIDSHQSKDRIRVDRIITFSEKRLKHEKFCKFLNELAHICLSEGKLDLASEIFRKSKKLTDDDQTKAESLLGLADIFSRRAKWNRSIEITKSAKSLYKLLGDNRGLARCENILGTIYGELGDIITAKKCFLTSLSLINREEDFDLAANLYSNLGIVFNIQGYNSDAINHLNKALAIYNKIGNDKNTSEVNLNIGIVNLDYGNFPAALTALDAAIEIAKNSQFLSTLCLSYHVKAQVLIRLNDFYYASEFVNKALEMSHKLDDRVTVADIYKVKGIIERNLGNYSASETYLLNSLRINESINNELNIAETSYELGLLYEKMNDSSLKNSYLKKSKTYYKNIESSVNVEKIDSVLSFAGAI